MRVYIRRNKKGFGMELKESKIEIDDSVKKEILELPKDMEEKSMRCTINSEDHSFHNVEEDLTEEDPCATGGIIVDDDLTEDDPCAAGGIVVDDDSGEKEVEDEVDILECNDDNNETEVFVQCNDDDDGTDACSSSFCGTDSETENETALNDQEADSMICNDTSLPFWVKKRKLTDHYRRCVQPITWRCKWVELKIKELQNQAQIYDKEVEESCQAKQLELENLKSKELGIKALPLLPCHTQKTKLKKRKKRKRVEETTDAPSYALNHNLFSYYECRKSLADIALNDNSQEKRNKSNKDETVFLEEIPPLEGDAYLEQILLKIEAAKSEALNLKKRVDKVLSENPSTFTPVNTLNQVGSADVFTSSEQQKPDLVVKKEDEKPTLSEEKPVKSASVSSHHDDGPEEDDETTDILLSEILASSRREGKAIVLDKKLKNTEQPSVEEGPSSRPVRKRTPRNREVITKEETNPKRRRGLREKPKSNVTMASRFKIPNRKRKRGKRRSGSTGLRRRS